MEVSCLKEVEAEGVNETTHVCRIRRKTQPRRNPGEMLKFQGWAGHAEEGKQAKGAKKKLSKK